MRFWPSDPALIDSILGWAKHRLMGPPDPETGARSASALEESIGVTITPSGIGGHEALRRFTDIAVHATRPMDDPLNLAYVPAAPTEAAVAFDLAVSATEIFAGMWDAGAGAIHLENQALRWIADLLGWPDHSGGTFVNGATMGNLSALHTARERRRDQGHTPEGRWTVAACSEAHSSVRSAARILNADVLPVATDDVGRMTGEALREAIEGFDGDGLFGVVASAGTTNAGIVDDLAGLADVCAEFDLWLHVDGAYGGAALVAPSAAAHFVGIDRVDSFVVDPHKWLFAPYDACALLYKDPSLAYAAHSQHAGYLDFIDRTDWNPSDYAIHMTRRARGLPFWFSLATYGTDRYRDAVERVLTITRTVADGIAERDGLELVMEPQLSTVLFRSVGMGEEAMLEWSQRNAREGVAFIIPTRWRDESVFRLCFVNPDTDPAVVLGILDTLT